MVKPAKRERRRGGPQPWDHPGIIAAVKRRGSSLRSLSVGAGFAPNTLQASLYRRHPRAHAVIAAFLGLTRHEIWPTWYGADDQPLPRLRGRA